MGHYRDPATAAAAKQIGTGYKADLWLNIHLEPLTKVWQGINDGDYDQVVGIRDKEPTPISSFFLSEEDARGARGAYAGTDPHKFAQSLWRLAQVAPSATDGFRQGIREYVVDIRTLAAIGVCLANRETKGIGNAVQYLGNGTAVQYYIPDWPERLRRTGRQYKFDRKNHPTL